MGRQLLLTSVWEDKNNQAEDLTGTGTGRDSPVLRYRIIRISYVVG